MVVLKECNNMFWGVTLDGGKRYSQTVDKPFHLSMAALESNAHVSDSSRHVQVMLQHDSAEFLLCTLGHGNVLQQQLDLSFSRDEAVTFFLNGGGVVHLTGSLIEELDDEFPDDYDDGDVDSDLEMPQLVEAEDDDSEEVDSDWEPPPGSKRKILEELRSKGKRLKLSEMNDDEEESDEEFDSSFIDEDVEEEEEGSDEDEDEEEEGDEDSILEQIRVKSSKSQKSPKTTEVSSKKSKKLNSSVEATPDTSKKAKNKTPKSEKANKSATQAAEEALTNGAGDATKKKKKKKKKNKNKTEENTQEKQPEEEASGESASPKLTPAPGKKRTVAGGIVVEDVKIGHGPEAKPGKNVSVYYVGTLAKNTKRFDSCLKGKPFRFRIGRGEVIKGWDTGLIGMKVGGKRKLTVPPSQGYGNSRQGPIPPGSTLVFDVEMKAVN
ncbi:46 kDa FK506-binding nuclear protein-like isoform X2 [Littorina saxatilis]|uniref:FK506-binding protein n=1 Tax=Littorina saxatilis TaxID=31220 RepID=A0AAN9C2L4_9CAEN